jgi:imidazolonepropionase-like amidohydrolase
MLVGLMLCLTIPLRVQAQATSVAITNVSVIDVEAGRVVPNVTVVVQGERIAAVGTNAPVPAGARSIDGRGKFLIPGLWDMHVHTAWPGMMEGFTPLYIANGVTGVREMFGTPPAVKAWRDTLAGGRYAAPRVVAPGHILDGPRPIWPGSATAGSAEQGRRAVDSLKATGADFIKVYSLLPRDAYFAIARRARELNIPFAGHVPEAVNVGEASDSGQRTIEHVTGFALACSSREAELREARATAGSDPQRIRAVMTSQVQAALDSYDPAKCQALFEKLKKNGTWMVPTLTVLRSTSHLDDTTLVRDPRLKYLPKAITTGWNPRTDFRMRDRTPEDWARAKRVYERNREMIGAMAKAGVPMLAGTDVLNPYCFPGFSLHDELALLVGVGVSPIDALRMATLRPAQFLGMTDRVGTIAAGKLADLVLLDANPLQDIRNTTRIATVLANGRVYTRADLDAILANAERSAAAQ